MGNFSSCLESLRASLAPQVSLGCSTLAACLTMLALLKGKFQIQNGTSYCDKCPGGKYQSISGAHLCFVSAEQPTRAMLRVKICDVGTYFSHSACSKCPTGKFQDRSGQPSCIACPTGKFQSHAGQYYCWASTMGERASKNKKLDRPLSGR